MWEKKGRRGETEERHPAALNNDDRPSCQEKGGEEESAAQAVKTITYLAHYSTVLELLLRKLIGVEERGRKRLAAKVPYRGLGRKKYIALNIEVSATYVL